MSEGTGRRVPDGMAEGIAAMRILRIRRTCWRLTKVSSPSALGHEDIAKRSRSELSAY